MKWDILSPKNRKQERETKIKYEKNNKKNNKKESRGERKPGKSADKNA